MRMDFPVSATWTDHGGGTVTWVSGRVEKADELPDFTLPGEAFVARYGRPWPNMPAQIRPDGVHPDCAMYRNLANGGGHTVCRMCGSGERCPHAAVLFPAKIAPAPPTPTPSPPGPHVAALHAIAAAIDGLAAAVRGERAKVRDDGK